MENNELNANFNKSIAMFLLDRLQRDFKTSFKPLYDKNKIIINQQQPNNQFVTWIVVDYLEENFFIKIYVGSLTNPAMIIKKENNLFILNTDDNIVENLINGKESKLKNIREFDCNKNFSAESLFEECYNKAKNILNKIIENDKFSIS